MIRFEQTYVEDGVLCGNVILDNESIGQFGVSVPQWDKLREHITDDIIGVWNEQQVSDDRIQQNAEALL